MALTTPDLGFDRRGQREVEEGSRQLLARLDAEEGAVFLEDEEVVQDLSKELQAIPST